MRPEIRFSLSPAEKGRLQKLLANEKNPKQMRRFQAILLADELPKEKVATMVGMTVRMLQILARSYKKNGIGGITIKKQPGRPPVINERKREQIIREIESSPYGWSTKQIRELISKRGKVLFSKRHIYRIAQKWGFAEVVPRSVSNRRASKSTIYRFKKKPKRKLLGYQLTGR